MGHGAPLDSTRKDPPVPNLKDMLTIAAVVVLVMYADRKIGIVSRLP